MAENTDPENKEKVVEEEGIISLDDLDSLLAEEDPEFADQMEKISEDEDLKNADVEIIDFDESTDEIEEEEKKPSFFEKHPKLAKVITPVLGLRKKVVEKIKLKINQAYQGLFKTLTWLKKDFPGLAKQKVIATKGSVLNLVHKVKAIFKKFSDLPKKQKMGIYTTLVFVLSLSGLIVFSTKKSWIPSMVEPMFTSLESVGEGVENFKETEKMRSLYQAFPQPDYLVQLEKIVVNLTSTTPRGTPMGTMEFYLDVDSNETAIEIKDREPQVLDVTGRAVEEFTYQQLRTNAGLAKMKAAVRFEINNILNQGRVNKVYLKTIVLKYE
jgi:flagellar basal body-associated protein FliL/5'(3')-deoxyribonucleotidase